MPKSKEHCNSPFSRSTDVKDVPILHVNLDLPPSQRWNVPYDNLKRQGLVTDIYRHIDELLGTLGIAPVGYPRKMEWWKKIIFDSIIYVLSWISFFFSRYHDDMLAVSRIFNISVGEVFIANMLLEIVGGCTSIICADKEDTLHRPIHGRTLDWPCFPLAKYTVQIVWYRNGRELFHSVGWPGMVGVMTGCKPGKFAISLNARYPNTPPKSTVKYFYQGSDEATKNVISQALRRGASALSCSWGTSTLIRSVLENEMDYDSAIDRLSSNRVIAPCYFVVSGKDYNQGVIIAKGTTKFDVKQTKMYSDLLVQTNHDIGMSIEDDPNDECSIDRFDFARSQLENGGNVINIASVLTSSMSKKKGVRNMMTLYMCVMKPYDEVNCMVSVLSTKAIGPIGF